MSKSLKNIIALVAIVVALASCSKNSVIYPDLEESADGVFKTASAGESVDQSSGAAALPPSMPSTGTDGEGGDGSTTSGNISDDDDDESDDDASVKRNAQNK